MAFFGFEVGGMVIGAVAGKSPSSQFLAFLTHSSVSLYR